MRIIDYFSSGRQEHWLSRIGRCDWSAGKYLYELLSRDALSDIAGENPHVLLLADGDELVSFCTLTQKDDIQPTELSPWIGFVYTFPQHRGHRHAGTLLAEAERLAAGRGAEYVYISTDHDGLYETYGYEFFRLMDDVNGEPSRVYQKRVFP